jgi:hypothetical protein
MLTMKLLRVIGFALLWRVPAHSASTDGTCVDDAVPADAARASGLSRARTALEHYGFPALPDFGFPGLTLAHLEDEVFPILMIDDFLTAGEIAAMRALAASPRTFAASRAGRVAGGPASTRSSTR